MRLPHQAAEFIGEELLARDHIVWFAVVIGKVPIDRGHAREELLAEEVDLVEEEDEGGFLEILAVGDGFEEHKSFVHLVLWDVS